MYAPNSHQLHFLNRLIQKVTEVKKGSLLLGGDFRGRIPDLGPFIQREDLFDVWRCLHATERDYTFFSGVHSSYSRIDLFLADLSLLQHTSECTILWSDHAAISLTIQWDHPLTPVRLWRSDTYLINHKIYGPIISDQLCQYFELNTHLVSNPFTLWCAHKAVIREIMIQFGARLSKQKKQVISHLISIIHTLENKNKSCPDPKQSQTLSLEI